MTVTANVLAGLLRDERPTDPLQAVTLFGYAWDDPYRFLFGVQPRKADIRTPARALDQAGALVRGGAAQLRAVHTQHERALQGVGAAVLRGEPGAALVLLPADSDTGALVTTLDRAASAAAATLTLSSTATPLPARALFDGVFPAPVRVVGVPGVHPYQGRINKYYDLASPSTIPSPDLIAARRHFGQALSLIDHGIDQARQSRGVFSMIEALPFAERCTHCLERPAEITRRARDARSVRSSAIGGDEALLCGVCRARLAAGVGSAFREPLIGLIYYQVPDAWRLLHAAHTPAAYLRTWKALRSALQRALEDCVAAFPSAERLFDTVESGVLTIGAADTLGALRKLESRFAALVRDQGPPTPALAIGVALGNAHPVQLFADAARASQTVLQRPDAGRIALHLHAGSASQTVVYDLDSLDRLADLLARIRSLVVPPDLFSDLSGQIARGTASLYYSYARLRLDASSMRVLDAIEAQWGKETPRFYHALNHALALRQLSGTA